MTVSDFSIRIILLFLPGVITFLIVDNLTDHKQTRNVHWLIYSMLFGFVDYAVFTLLMWLCNSTVDFWYALIDQSVSISYSEIFYTILVGILVSAPIVLLSRTKAFFWLFHKIKLTKRHGYPDSLSYMLDLYKTIDYLIVTDWEKQIRVVGHLMALSEDTDKKDEIVLQDCIVYDLNTAEELYKVDVLYIAQNHEKITIEVEDTSEEISSNKEEQTNENKK